MAARTTTRTAAALCLLALASAMHVTAPADDQHVIEAAVYSVDNAKPTGTHESDVGAGAPGGYKEGFPSNVPFTTACDDMEEDDTPEESEPAPKRQGSNVPSPQQVAEEMANEMRRLCRKCNCGCANATIKDTRQWALDLVGLISVVQHKNSTPKCEPGMPVPEETEETQSSTGWLTDLGSWRFLSEKIREHKAHLGETVEQRKQRVDDKHREEEYVTEQEEAAQRTNPGNHIPTIDFSNCDDDDAGATGQSNEDVAGASTKMNTGFKPSGINVAPKPVAFLETKTTKDGGCTMFKGSQISPDTPSETVEADGETECAEACLFDEACRAFEFKQINEVTTRCRTFGKTPLILTGDAVTGLCGDPDGKSTTLPLCQNTLEFQSAHGGCDTYVASHPYSNNIHCDADTDSGTNLRADQACPQCGRCEATPTPTPLVYHTTDSLPLEHSGMFETPCITQRYAAVQKLETGPGLGEYVPDCAMDGAFKPRQCKGELCFCVYESGVIIDGTFHAFDAPSPCRETPPVQTTVFPKEQTYPTPRSGMFAVRTLAKIVAMLQNRRLCLSRFSKPIEPLLLNLNASDSRTCRSATPTTENVLELLTECIVPNLEPLPSASASPSPSPSPSPSMETMCGGGKCGSDETVPIHRSVDDRCSNCKGGTSGPCKNLKTQVCSDYRSLRTCPPQYVACRGRGF